MENRKEPLIVTALVAGLLGLGAAQPAAEADARPTLAVVSFKGSGISPEIGDAMADELAAQFVETGRYRVMPRNWLVAAQAAPVSVDALREAAAAAKVEYLVLGEAQHGMSLGTTARDIVFIAVRVISVATGEVVRTAAGRTQAAPRAPRRPLIMPMRGPGRPAGILGHLAASAVLTHSAKRASAPAASSAQRGWERPLADIARAITLPGIK